MGKEIKNENDGKFIFGICKVNEKGQIVIPKNARDVFEIKAGDSLILLGDVNKGMALVKAETFEAAIGGIMGKGD